MHTQFIGLNECAMNELRKGFQDESLCARLVCTDGDGLRPNFVQTPVINLLTFDSCENLI